MLLMCRWIGTTIMLLKLCLCAIAIEVTTVALWRDEGNPFTILCMKKQMLISQEANTISVSSLVSLEQTINNVSLISIYIHFWRQCKSEKIVVTLEANIIFSLWKQC